MDALFGGLVALAVAALLALWLTIFPDTRQALWQAVATRLQAFGARGTTRLRRSGRALRDNGRQASDRAAGFAHRMRQHWKLIAASLVILVVPAVLVLSMRQHVALQGYNLNSHPDQNISNLVARLLHGERLVPPPPLPPKIFVTREVEKELPHMDLGHANRDWNRLDSQFRQHLLAVFKIMQERYGYHMVMIEGYRSPQRQAWLAAKGGNVTNAGANQSYHQYGLAADCAFYRDGKLVIAARSAWARRGYKLYGKVAKAAGLVWGGSWKSIRDLGHVELHLPGKGPRYHR